MCVCAAGLHHPGRGGSLPHRVRQQVSVVNNIVIYIYILYVSYVMHDAVALKGRATCGSKPMRANPSHGTEASSCKFSIASRVRIHGTGWFMCPYLFMVLSFMSVSFHGARNPSRRSTGRTHRAVVQSRSAK